MNGTILYDGKSLLDGKPIVVIATGLNGKSRNAKTGNMVQTWIMRSDIAPHEAVKSGDDKSVCGNCKHRGTIDDGRNVGRSCYVTVHQAPLSVYKAYKRGAYPMWNGDASLFSGLNVRLGAYGDPAAAPSDIWASIVSAAKSHTGYTHQWQAIKPTNVLRTLAMASCDSESEQEQASKAGWRTFRVRTEQENLASKEIACPASDEAGKLTDCASCGLCGGASKLAKSIAIIAHGSAAKVSAFNNRS